jgi:DNA topoisomerase-1
LPLTKTKGGRRRRAGSAKAAPDSAAAARLRYVTDQSPGIRRIASGGTFRYVSADGKPIRDPATLERIRTLAIPPAWTSVWICPDPRGHLQATGRDARGRKQHRYHPRWREVRDEVKFDRMLAFARALSAIRRQTARDLARPGLPRRKVVAAVVQLLEKTLIRVGNDEYARGNQSYGLTTLRDQHALVSGSTVRFRFRGKSGKAHDIRLTNRRLAQIVRRCRDLPGAELFQYVDDHGRVVDIGSSDINEYLREVAGQDFTAKDFRTWAGTVLAACALGALTSYSSSSEAKRNMLGAIDGVAALLGNTRTICRKSYIHPAVLDGYMDGTLLSELRALERVSQRPPAEALVEAEHLVMRVLRRR